MAILALGQTLSAGQVGKLEFQRWDGISVSNLKGLLVTPKFHGPASQVALIDSAQTAVNQADGFGARLRGYLIAPVSGEYQFWLSSDDQGVLNLSTNGSKFNRQTIASVPTWTLPQQWDLFASQKSVKIPLQAGQKYYVEVLYQDGGGGDHAEIAWQIPNGQREIIPASALESYSNDPQDADDDGMSSDWEISNGLNPNLKDAAADPDLDGAPNGLEFFQESDPKVKSQIAGALTHELWWGIPGYRIKDLCASPKFLQAADSVSLLSRSEGPSQIGDFYGNRARGYLTAPVSGDYRFWALGDDETQVWLSSSASQFDKKLIVQPANVSYSFDADVSQKSKAISLQAGQRYYFEILHKADYSTDFFSVAWQVPGQAREIIPSSALLSFVPTADDQDDDGLLDAWEVSNGLKSNDNGGIDPKQGSNGDCDGDGLSNLEEFYAGTKANAADSDADGVNDSDELKLLETNALSADVAPFAPLQNVAGNAFITSQGEWIKDGAVARQVSTRGRLDYAISTTEATVHQLDLAFTNIADPESNRAYEFVISIDGQAPQRIKASADDGGRGIAKGLLPFLQPGAHTLSVFLDNSLHFRKITLDSLQISAARGTDANANRIPDWVDLRLAKRNSVEVPLQSLTSPAFIEGKSRWPELGKINLIKTLAPAPGQGYFANISLNLNVPTAVNLELENGGLLVKKEVSWLPFNVKASSQLTIRRGDALKLSAFSGTVATEDESITVSVEGVTSSASAQQCVVHTFNNAGDIPVQVTYQNTAGISTHQAMIRVLAAPVIENPAFVQGQYRDWSVPTLSTGLALEVDPRAEIMSQSPNGFSHTLRLNSIEPHFAAIRLGGKTGPILSSIPMQAMRLRTGSDTAVMYGPKRDASTYTLEMPIMVDQMPASVRLDYWIFIAGVTFENGSTSMSLNTNDFSDLGEKKLIFLKASQSGSNCHRAAAYQGNTRIGLFY